MVNQHGDDDQIFQFISIEGMQFGHCRIPFGQDFSRYFRKIAMPATTATAINKSTIAVTGLS